MKAPKAVINVNGEDIVMEGFYRSFWNVGGMVTIARENNGICEIENLTLDKDVTIINKDLKVVVKAGEKVTFQTVLFTDETLNFVFKTRSAFNYDEDAEDDSEKEWDCYD